MTKAFMRRCGGCPMSPDHTMHQVRVLGDGCAALSLAARADELAGYRLTLVKPQGAPPEIDHIWGFWDGPSLAAASGLARKRWHSWSIVTGRGKAVLRSQERPYTALHRLDWTAHCRAAASRAGVATLDGDEAATAAGLVFDSRPPPVLDGMMLQHFLGLEV